MKTFKEFLGSEINEMKWAQEVAPEMEEALAKYLSVDLDQPPENWSGFIGKVAPKLAKNLITFVDGKAAAKEVMFQAKLAEDGHLEKVAPKSKYQFLWDGLKPTGKPFPWAIGGSGSPKADELQ